MSGLSVIKHCEMLTSTVRHVDAEEIVAQFHQVLQVVDGTRCRGWVWQKPELLGEGCHNFHHAVVSTANPVNVVRSR